MKPTPIVPDLCLSCRRYVQTRRCSRCGEVFPVCHEGYAVKHFSETIALCGECLQCALVRWWEAEGRPSLKSEEL